LSLPPLTYLAIDSLAEGIGASQVLAYAERLSARGVEVRLHSFEKDEPAAWLRERVQDAGVTWTPHPFGRFGAAGGVKRVATAALAARGAALVHARSDLAAAAVLAARARHWVWDVRSLYADQRLELGTLRAGSPQHRLLRAIERRAARRSTAVITLTEGVIPVLEARHGISIAEKTRVITTCVDTSRFMLTPVPDPHPLHLLLAGTLNRYYDVPAMVALVAELTRRRPTALTLATPGETPWDEILGPVVTDRIMVRPDHMPEVIGTSHVGLSVCRDDAGVSLRGSMPTKIGEFLAAGRPVVVNPGLGDAGRLLIARRCGVALAGTAPAAVALAADEVETLVEDPNTAQRCRQLALDHFDLDRGVDRLIDIYRRAADDVPQGGATR